MSYLTRLNLQNYRCYEHTSLDDLQSGLVVLCGANGAGKTNVLEAISLLTPGRGLRSAKALDIQKSDSPTAWGISAKVETGGVEVTLGTGLNPENDRRMSRINGAVAKSQMALADYLACLWLTPQMDRLFLEGSSGRRRFLDRMIFAFDPSHSGRVTRYENALRQRAKLLSEEGWDESWVSGLEKQMAETGMAITAARMDFLDKLKASFLPEGETKGYFPRAGLTLSGALEDLLEKNPALEAENKFIELLVASRPYDAVAGGAKEGAHKTDLEVVYTTKNMPASQCSTGEQKALLISIILAHGRLMNAERGAPPVLLLDEIAAHLDEDRREALFNQLMAMGGQVWMTGTDPVLFDSIKNQAQFFEVKSAQITPAKKLKLAS
ncbi:MAG: DNA replication/repair protein RecF [Pseudomonadota bacterium]